MDANDVNDLMLALHDLFEAVQQQRQYSAEETYDLLNELLELVAEERGAFLADDI